MGWIVLLQVGILVVDRLHFGSSLPAGKMAAIVIILAAQGYLLLAPELDVATPVAVRTGIPMLTLDPLGPSLRSGRRRRR